MEQQLRTINIAGSTNMLHSSDKTEETFFPFFFFFSMLNTIFCVYGLAIFQSAAISSEEHIFKQHNNNIVRMYVWRISIILNAVEQCEWKLLMNKGSNVALHLGWWQRTKKKYTIAKGRLWPVWLCVITWGERRKRNNLKGRENGLKLAHFYRLFDFKVLECNSFDWRLRKFLSMNTQCFDSCYNQLIESLPSF